MGSGPSVGHKDGCYNSSQKPKEDKNRKENMCNYMINQPLDNGDVEGEKAQITEVTIERVVMPTMIIMKKPKGKIHIF